MGWLSKFGIKTLYRLLVIYLVNKNQAKIVFKKSIIKIEREIAYIIEA